MIDILFCELFLLLLFVSEAEEQYGSNEKACFTQIAERIIEAKDAFATLDNIQVISEALKKYLQSADGAPKLYRKNEQNLQSMLQKRIATLCKKQKIILSCPKIDEHVLLLACLKGLEKEFPTFYKIVLKEILTKQLHKIEQIEHTTHIVGRKKELGEIIRILKRTERNNVLLIGKSGIGKTTLAQAIQEEFPDKKLMRLFPGNDIFFDQVISILTTTEKSVLFFLDELPTFEISQINYLLENGQIIATANDSAYKKFAADNIHIISKYGIINLEEPSPEDLHHILSDKAKELIETYHINFEQGSIDELIQLAKQYINEPAFPAKGLSLLEEVLQTAQTQQASFVSKDLIRAVIAEKTNIPISSLTEFEKKDLADLPNKLQMKVKGQDSAVAKVATAIQRARIGFKKANKPIGSFLFVGPSGVGKTELAKAIAKEVFGDEDAMVRLDMSEFAEAHMVQRLIGSPPGYVGFEEGGQLTNPVTAKPYSLILLDEIEKAHPRVFDIFLQVLDDGRLTDGQGKKVDFRNTVIVATSNAGIEDMLDMIAEGKTHSDIEKEIKEVLADYFRVEFINRFDGLVIFDPLNVEALVGIAQLQIQKLQNELLKRNIILSVRNETMQRLAKEAYDPRYGARGLLRLLQDTIENTLAEMIIQGKLEDGQTIEF